MSYLEQVIEALSQSIGQHETAWLQRGKFAALTLVQIHYLDTISHLENPTISELARAMDVSKPTATVAIDRLADRGYVNRVQSDNDRRVRHLHLTTAGSAIADEHDAMHRKFATHFRDALSDDEVTTLVWLLQKVLRKI